MHPAQTTVLSHFSLYNLALGYIESLAQGRLTVFSELHIVFLRSIMECALSLVCPESYPKQKSGSQLNSQ